MKKKKKKKKGIGSVMFGNCKGGKVDGRKKMEGFLVVNLKVMVFGQSSF